MAVRGAQTRFYPRSSWWLCVFTVWGVAVAACTPDVVPIEPCNLTSDCEAPQVCLRGVCTAPPRDAGADERDAGLVDAGPDAGLVDAGPDAGLVDAGLVDAGPDAGLVDAGPDAGLVDSGPDAGPPDAGTPDAGPPDAGPVDAGPPDAGPVDAGPMRWQVAYLDGAYNTVETADFDAAIPLGPHPSIRADVVEDMENYALRWTSFLVVPEGGMYTFSLRSDDGAVLRVDGHVVVNHDGPHVATSKTALWWLPAGIHAVDVRYAQLGGARVLELTARLPGQTPWVALDELYPTETEAEAAAPGLSTHAVYEPPAWWSPAYTHRTPLALSTRGLNTVPPGQTLPLVLAPGDPLRAHIRANLADLRVVRHGPSGPEALPIQAKRIMDDGVLWVGLGDHVPRDGVDYWLYYGNPGADRYTPHTAAWDDDVLYVAHLDDVPPAVLDHSPAEIEGGFMLGERVDAPFVQGRLATSPGYLPTFPVSDAPLSISLYTQLPPSGVLLRLDRGPDRITVERIEAGLALRALPDGGAPDTEVLPVSDQAWHAVTVTIMGGDVSLQVDRAAPVGVSMLGHGSFGATQMILAPSWSAPMDELVMEARLPGPDAHVWRAAALEDVLWGDAHPARPPTAFGPHPTLRVAGAAVEYDFMTGFESTGTAAMPPFSTPGVALHDGAAVFDGTARLSTAATGLFGECADGPGLTVEAWVLPTQTRGRVRQSVVGMGSPAATAFALEQRPTAATRGGHYALRLHTDNRGTSTETVAETAGDTVVLHRPQHVVFTHAVATGTLKVYVDGTEQPAQAQAAPGDYDAWSLGGAFALGAAAERPDLALPWQGRLPLAAVYCRALSDAEVAQNFRAGP